MCGKLYPGIIQVKWIRRGAYLCFPSFNSEGATDCGNLKRQEEKK